MGSKSVKETNSKLLLGITILVLLLLSLVIIKGSNQPNRDNQKKVIPTQAGDATITPQKYFDDSSRVIQSPELKKNPNDKPFRYELKLPSGWDIEKIFSTNNPINLVIVKDGHRLDINSVSLGDPCVSSSDKKSQSQYGISDRFITVNTGFGSVRIMGPSINPNSQLDYVIFNVCQLNVNSNDPDIKEWETNTKLGLIRYRVPSSYDQKLIDEMNDMVSHITIIE